MPLWLKGTLVCSNEGARPFLDGDNNVREEIHKQNSKNSFPEPLGQFHSNLPQSILVWRDSSLFKERTQPFPRGDNNKIKKKQ